MKFVLFLLIPFYLMASDIKKIEWFPAENEVNKFEIPCEEKFPGTNPWRIKQPGKEFDINKSAGAVMTCNLLHLKI